MVLPIRLGDPLQHRGNREPVLACQGLGRGVEDGCQSDEGDAVGLSYLPFPGAHRGLLDPQALGQISRVFPAALPNLSSGS